MLNSFPLQKYVDAKSCDVDFSSSALICFCVPLPAAGDLSSLLWCCLAAVWVSCRWQGQLCMLGTRGQQGADWPLLLQQHMEYDLLHGDVNSSSKGCSGSPGPGISTLMPPPAHWLPWAGQCCEPALLQPPHPSPF